MKLENNNERPLLEATLENIEVIFDIASDGNFWSEVPVVSTAFKLLRASDTIREKLFAKKISIFFDELNRVPDSTRKQMRQKIVESPQELEEVGNTLLMVLDKVTEFNKPRLLGNLFVAYLDNIISKEDMLRLIYAVEVAFADDLRKLIQNGTASDVGSHLEFLVPSGLSCVVAGGWSNMGSSSTEVSYKTTILANKMLQAYYHVNGTPNL